MHKLTLSDILDHRAYERERDEFRARIIAMKKRRRIPLGPVMTIVFENTDTMRFQVQEMARVERMLTDEQIQHEIDTYNDLIPDDGELRATLLIELTSEVALREWLPKLVGIQRAISFEMPDGTRVPGEPIDEQRLTREEVTASVHFLRFAFTPEQRAAFADGPVRLLVEHEHYTAAAALDADQRAELATDLS
jgi:hypothetical protein